MPKIKITVNHKLGRKVAVNRVKQLTESKSSPVGKELSDLKNIWNNDTSEFTCIVKGIRINGALDVRDDSVMISGNLPLVLFPLRKQIEKVIQQYATTLLT